VPAEVNRLSTVQPGPGAHLRAGMGACIAL